MPGAGVRYGVAGPDALRRLAELPLPLGLREQSAVRHTSPHRDVYFDTPDGVLRARNASYRLRYLGQGECLLSLTFPGSHSAARIALQDQDAMLAGDSEPARLVRALVDPGSLVPWIELQVIRTTRIGRPRWPWGGRFQFCYDEVTLSHDGSRRSFCEMKVLRLARGTPSMERLARALSDAHDLRASLTTKLERAEALNRQLNDEARTYHLAPGRAVVVVAMNDGAIAVVAPGPGDRVRFPTGPGAGEDACRGVLQTWLHSRVGELTRAGTAETASGDRTLEVWVARRVRDQRGSGQNGLSWVAAERVAQQLEQDGFSDPETLAAYRVVKDAGLLPRLEARGPRVHQRPADEDVRAGELAGNAAGFLDRPGSELAFIARVLALAEDARVPVLERLRYVGIVSANLDEFYMGSAGALRQRADDPDGRDQLARLTEGIGQLLERQRAAFDACLRLSNTRLRSWETLGESDRDALRARFSAEILALLTPRAITVSPGHPFPVVPPLTLAFAVAFDQGTGPVHYAYLKLPTEVPRFLPVADSGFVPLEQVVRAEIGKIYPNRTVQDAWLFRITRQSDLALDEPRAGDLLQAVAEDLDQRRDNPLVRVEVEEGFPADVLDALLRELRFQGRLKEKPGSAPEIQRVKGLMALADLRQLASAAVALPPDPHSAERRGGTAMEFPPFTPRHPFPSDRHIWDAIRAADRLVHHPYDDFGTTVLRFLNDAADDPEVTTIKLTLYRSGDRSPLVDALERAARAGKDVAAFIELKARFDEARNVLSVKRLERAGAQVVYGVVGLKNHAKLALVVRREDHGLRRYAHIGTGNYNAGTARVYTDLGLFSANSELTEDVHDLFNQLTGTSGPPKAEFRRLLVAPAGLLPGLLERIEREVAHVKAGRNGRIRAKMNGLDDPEIIRALYRASQAGVRIELFVRGICTLKPGVPGLSDGIRVQSVLGRFLEHPRVYYFEDGGATEYYISSADWRSRNLRRRVEVAAPVLDPECRRYLAGVLQLEHEDPTAWVLQSDGRYVPPIGAVGDPRSMQSVLQVGRT